MASEGQQHPLSIYFWIWGVLFVVSFFSYMVDYIGFQGYLRWTLIIVFMLVKAGLIVSIFMHMYWERRALKLAILMPPIAILIFITLMSLEGDNTFLTRIEFFGESNFVTVTPHHLELLN